MVRLPPPDFAVQYGAFSFPAGAVAGDGKLSLTADDRLCVDGPNNDFHSTLITPSTQL
ncbi:MAG: hypothetical protein V7637_3171 [Mycobacteriales bacterium]